MVLKKVENPFIKVVMILVIATLILVALMYIMHLITYDKGETTLWQTTVNYVKPKPFLSKIKKDSPVMLEDRYEMVYLENSNREEELCSGFYRYETSLDAENQALDYNYLDHFCLAEELLIDLKKNNRELISHGIFSLDKEGIFYFVTNEHQIMNAANYSINRVYAYNLENGEYKIIWQELKESKPSDYQFSAYQEYDLLGISGTKLIFSKISTSGLGGDYRCFDVLANAGEDDLFTFHYLELSDENMEMQDYKIPAENILEAKRWSKECGEALGY